MDVDYNKKDGTMADEDSIARGRELAISIWGDAFEKRTIPHLERLDPAFREFIEGFVFGEVWSRPGLDLRTRSLCTVAALAALGRTHQLEGHITGALANGAGREEIVEVLLQMAV